MRAARPLAALAATLALAAGAWCAGSAGRRSTPDDLRVGALLKLTEVHRAQEAAMAADQAAGRPVQARSLEELVAQGRLPTLPEARGYRLEVGRSPLPGHWRGVAVPLEPGLPWCGVGDHEAFWGTEPIPVDPLAGRPASVASMELLARPPPRGWFGER